MAKDDDSLPTGRLARSAELIGLAGRMGMKGISAKAQSLFSESNPVRRLQAQMDQATLLVESLGRLKGAAMKVGQLLSIEAQDFLPPEVIELLSKLQSDAKPLPFAAISELIKGELGAKLFAQLKFSSEQPIAAASIGQVYLLTFNGQKVALKVQYPGVAESISSDLSLLRKLCESFLKLRSSKVNVESLFSELEEVLSLEVDYLAEMNSLKRYAEFCRPNPNFAVPQVIEELCRPRVLAMSYEQGLGLKEYMASKPSQAERDHFARLFLDLYVLEFFENAYVQTDPNFSNFRFRPESQQLLLLDFGATREYSRDFIQDYSELLALIRDASSEAVLEKCFQMDLMSPKESKECLELFVHMLVKSVEPFDEDKQPFVFSDKDYSQEVRQAAMAFTKKVRYSAPPHQLLFLHRKLGGLFSMLKALDARVDLRPYWESIVQKRQPKPALQSREAPR